MSKTTKPKEEKVLISNYLEEWKGITARGHDLRQIYCSRSQSTRKIYINLDISKIAAITERIDYAKKIPGRPAFVIYFLRIVLKQSIFNGIKFIDLEYGGCPLWDDKDGDLQKNEIYGKMRGDVMSLLDAGYGNLFVPQNLRRDEPTLYELAYKDVKRDLRGFMEEIKRDSIHDDLTISDAFERLQKAFDYYEKKKRFNWREES